MTDERPTDPSEVLIPPPARLPHDDSAALFAQAVAVMLDDKLAPVKKGLADLTDELQRNQFETTRRFDALERRIAVIEGTRLLLPTLPGMVALCLTLVQLIVTLGSR